MALERATVLAPGCLLGDAAEIERRIAQPPR